MPSYRNQSTTLALNGLSQNTIKIVNILSTLSLLDWFTCYKKHGLNRKTSKHISITQLNKKIFAKSRWSYQNTKRFCVLFHILFSITGQTLHPLSLWKNIWSKIFTIQDVFQRLPNRVFKYITYNKRVTA